MRCRRTLDGEMEGNKHMKERILSLGQKLVSRTCFLSCLVALAAGCSAEASDGSGEAASIGDVEQEVSVSATVGFLETTSATPRVDIFMDTENDGNGDFLTKPGSSANQLSITGIDRIPQPTNHGGVMFHVMQTTVSSLPRLQWDYVAFLFSDNCPANSYRFSEVFDNEDTDNQDYASGGVYPGWSRRDWTGTMLKFCFVPGTGVYSSTYPPWWDRSTGGSSGAIAAPNKTFFDYTSTVFPFKRTVSCNETQEALLDGEDSGFAGYIDYELVPTQYRANLDAIMDIRYGAPHFYINSCPHGIPVGI
jgi:hypothetical protein